MTGHGATASIRDVARAAGVSYQTVSRVINGHPSVSPPTRQTVLDTIERLEYRPNRAARALAGGPVQSVTVLASNTSLYGFSAALEGIEEATRESGFVMGVRVVEPDTPTGVRDAVERAIEPAGAIIVIAFDKAGVDALAAVPATVPVVAMVPAPTEGEYPSRPSVWIDEYAAARDATNYLLRLGHTTVHHLSIPSWTGTTKRMLGWRTALQEAGRSVPRPLVAGWDAEWGYEAGGKLAKKQDVTAVLCGNDDIAVGCIRAMHDASRSVPRDVSIIGFDDVPLAQFYSPALTTVRQDFKALGKVCFAKLLSGLADSTGEEALRYPLAQLVIRESAGPPPKPSHRPPTTTSRGRRLAVSINKRAVARSNKEE